MPKIVGKFGDNRCDVIQREAGLLPHPQTFHAAIDTQIIIGGVGIIIAFTTIGLVSIVNHHPACGFLTIEKHQITLIEATIFGSRNANGHLCQVVGTAVRILLGQSTRKITKKPNLIRIQALHIDTHCLQGGIIQLICSFLCNGQTIPSMFAQYRLIRVLLRPTHLSEQQGQ